MPDEILSAQTVRDRIEYDPETGVVTWRINRRRARAGALVGTKSGDYLRVKFDDVLYPLHRVIWLYVHGAWPEGVIDHRDGNGCNNRINNLRDVPEYVNHQNRRRPRAGSANKLMGIYWHSRDRRFIASIKLPGVKRAKELGRFHTAEEAHEAYLTAKRALHEGCTI